MIRVLRLVLLLGIPQIFLGQQQYVITTIAGGVPPSTPLAATTASIGDPPRVAVDSSGNLYFGSIHSIFKVDTAGILTRIAGTGRYGNSGDGAAALNAQLEYPDGIAVDAAGNVFFTDRDASIIRKISPGGAISTVAGTGTVGSSGDGGPAANALLSGPTGLTFDSAGNLYVADSGNNKIRRITPDGTITTVAGTGEFGYTGNGGPARDAQLSGPQGIAVGAAGDLYIADTFNNLVRKVTPDGIINNFAGNGFPGYSGDNGPATGSAIFLPTDVALDRQGNLYIADLGTIRVRKVSSGIISTIAGSSKSAEPLDGASAVAVRLTGPTGVTVDANGNVYFAEGSIGSGSGRNLGDFKIWKVTPDGIISTAAGNGLNSYSGDNGTAARAQVHTPSGLAVDATGNLYIADTGNNRIRKIAPDGSIVTVAGIGTAAFAGDYGPATSAALNAPMGVAVDPDGNLYIADTGNNRVRFINAAGMIYTVAGNGNAAFFGDGTVAYNASLHAPQAIAVDTAYNLYIADTEDHRIRKVGVDGIIDTVVGRGQGFGGDGGPATLALLNFPSGLAMDTAGNLYIADQANNRIRKVSPVGIITTVAGNNGFGTLGDGGPATSAQLKAPQGLAVDRAGNLYISDSGQDRIRLVATDGTIFTIAGNGRCCYSTDGVNATLTPINLPLGIAVAPAGNIYLSDSGNNAIRQLQLVRAGGVQSVVANAASNLPGPVAPGEIVTIYGSGLGPAQAAQYQQGSGAAAGTQLGGVSVAFNGIFAPLLFASATQVTAVVPYGVSGQSAQVVASYQSLITLSISLTLATSQPALFTADSSGLGQAVATNQDGSSNNASHPAVPGSTISLYATGEGLTSPAGVDGKPAAAPLPRPVLPVSVTIGGLPATVQSATESPGSLGVMQVSVVVPGGVQPGNVVPVSLQVGSVFSPAGVTIAVR